MRAILCLQDIGRSDAGNYIFAQKVILRVHTTSPKLRESLLSRMEDVTLMGEDGPQELTSYDLPVKEVHDFLVRLTKGLLRNFHPEHDYDQDEFRSRYVKDGEVFAEFEALKVVMKYEERGVDVFRFGHVLTRDGRVGIWHYTFYRVTSFWVRHESQTS